MLGLLFAVTITALPTGDGPRPQVMAPATTVEQLHQALFAAGGIDHIESEPRLAGGNLMASTDRYSISMHAHWGQFFSIDREDRYFSDFPFSTEKADVIRTPEEAKNRALKFMQEAHWNWEGVEVQRLTFHPHYVGPYVSYPERARRAYTMMLRETSKDTRRSRISLGHGQLVIDAQYGHILSGYSSFRQPLGPWRLTVSESKARRVALAEWTRAGFRFRDSHLTSQAKWIRTTSMPDYLPDQPYIAGWVIIARRDAKDRGATHSIWVHGETGAIVARHEPPVMSSPIGT